PISASSDTSGYFPIVLLRSHRGPVGQSVLDERRQPARSPYRPRRADRAVQAPDWAAEQWPERAEHDPVGTTRGWQDGAAVGVRERRRSGGLDSLRADRDPLGHQ